MGKEVRALTSEHPDASDLYLRTSGDPTLVGTSLDRPLSKTLRTLMNLRDRADAADDIDDIRSVLTDLISFLYTQTARGPEG